MAKTIRNKFDKYLTYSNLMEAHKLTAVGKTKKKDVILFNLKKEEYINWLLEELKTGRYKHSSYKTFYIYEPKKRKIQSAKYIDRIVHRWYVESFMKEYIIKQFINTSYACIKGRGMHRACVAVQKGMQHCKKIYGEYYIIKMDVLKYFQNINKDILYNLLSKKIADKKVLWLTKEIIYSTEGELSIPLGNYTSQVFANYYLHQYDIYAKETLKCKWYYRYMDDSVILVKDKATAINVLEKSRVFLREKLGLELNKKTQIFKSKQGVNFCGYKINENRMKIRDKGKRRLKKKVKILKEKVRLGKISSKEAHKYLTGHLGYIKYANTYNLEEKLFEKI